MLKHEDWRGNTAGTTWMHQLLIVSFRYIGLRPIYIFMGLLVVPCYMLFNHQGYLAVYRYLRFRHKYSRWKSFGFTYLNHYRFGQIILDRFAVYAGFRYEFELDGNEELLALMGQKGGFIILSSHVGNYEIAGYTFRSNGKQYNALVFPGEAQMVMENRKRILSQHNINMIPVGDDMSHIFAINNALAEGEIVSIPGDRIFGSPRFVECEFLGSSARFPLGPYALAVQRDVPVLAVFVMKVSAHKYKVYIRRVTAVSSELKSRNAKAAVLAQGFVREVEAVLRKYPEQWFNYYNFWKNAEE